MRLTENFSFIERSFTLKFWPNSPIHFRAMAILVLLDNAKHNKCERDRAHCVFLSLAHAVLISFVACNEPIEKNLTPTQMTRDVWNANLIKLHESFELE